MMEQRLIDANLLVKEFDDMGQDIDTLDVLLIIERQKTVNAVPVDFINQKIVELQSCASQYFDDGHEMLATCVLETIRLLGSFLKELRENE